MLVLVSGAVKLAVAQRDGCEAADAVVAPMLQTLPSGHRQSGRHRTVAPAATDISKQQRRS